MSHQAKRIMLISKLTKTLDTAEKEGKETDKQKLIDVLGFDYGVSRRTALEYIRCAKRKLELLRADGV